MLIKFKLKKIPKEITKIMSIKKSAEINLPYFKQGDDLNCSIVKDENDKVNAKETLRNHINLLQRAINILVAINEKIPEVNDVELYGDTHYISITGDERIINLLLQENLIGDPFGDKSDDDDKDRCESDNEDAGSSGTDGNNDDSWVDSSNDTSENEQNEPEL